MIKTKTFDCIEMKRRAAEHIYNEIKDLNTEEEFIYWEKKHKDFLKKQECILKKTKNK